MKPRCNMGRDEGIERPETENPTEALQRQSTTRQLKGEGVEEYKADTLFIKAFLVETNVAPEMEKQILGIFRCL